MMTKNLSLIEKRMERRSPDRLYRRRPRRQTPPVGLETHRTADLEVGATQLRIGSQVRSVVAAFCGRYSLIGGES